MWSLDERDWNFLFLCRCMYLMLVLIEVYSICTCNFADQMEFQCMVEFTVWKVLHEACYG